ncbi:MAG: phosphoenolpyruvate carboxykinase (GTP), partial [Armatimonadetes bacterium]|nr:phosphoenolpyruvate carboxykinase (GTP) [Armatimonadota bacterium]
FDWSHGVFIGSGMGSETTAAATGKRGVVRRDPMAMLPFCGYNMGDYFAHWLEMGKRIAHPPAIYHVNWFRKDAGGNFLWPGFDDNLRVLLWIADRLDGTADARTTPIGHLPRPEDLHLEGLDLSPEALEALFRVDCDAWEEEMEDLGELYEKLGDRLPEELCRLLNSLNERLREG